MPQTPPQTDTYNTALDIFDRTHPLRVDVDENLKVVGTVTTVPTGIQTVVVAYASGGVNLFASNDSISSGSEQTLLSFTAPAGIGFNVTQMIAWGTVDAEFLIYTNGILSGGGRSSPSTRTCDIHYDRAGLPVAMGDTITVTVSQFFGTPQQFRVNILGA